jgi:predicted transcriptional regulator
MKTAISIDDDLLRQADDAARAMGVSRSKVISLAVGEFLRRQREAQMLQTLNDVYGGEPDPGEAKLVRSLKKRVGRTIRDRW